MSRHIFIIMTWFLVICTETKAQQVSIAPYYGGRQAALYHHPLTIVIDGSQLVDIDPHGNPVSVRICSAQHQSEP